MVLRRLGHFLICIWARLPLRLLGFGVLVVIRAVFVMFVVVVVVVIVGIACATGFHPGCATIVFAVAVAV